MIGTTNTKKRSSHRLIVGVVLILIVAINWVATQYIAAHFAYHRALGAPVIGHVYLPWQWLIWKSQFGTQYPRLFQLAMAGVSLVTTLLVLGVLVAAAIKRTTAQRYDDVHGTAHWASRAEIEATGLLPRRGGQGRGVYVGGWRDDKGRLHYLRHNGPEHIAAIAPTRSGKGVGLVVPTLLSWPHSIVVNDQKAELWNLTG